MHFPTWKYHINVYDNDILCPCQSQVSHLSTSLTSPPPPVHTDTYLKSESIDLVLNSMNFLTPANV